MTAQRPTRRPEWGLGLPRALTAASRPRTAAPGVAAARLRRLREERSQHREFQRRMQAILESMRDWGPPPQQITLLNPVDEVTIEKITPRESEPIVTPRTAWWVWAAVWAAVGVGLVCSGAGILLWATHSAG